MKVVFDRSQAGVPKGTPKVPTMVSRLPLQGATILHEQMLHGRFVNAWQPLGECRSVMDACNHARQCRRLQALARLMGADASASVAARMPPLNASSRTSAQLPSQGLESVSVFPPAGSAIPAAAEPPQRRLPEGHQRDAHIAGEPDTAGLRARWRAEPAHRLDAWRRPAGLAPRAARERRRGAVAGRQPGSHLPEGERAASLEDGRVVGLRTRYRWLGTGRVSAGERVSSIMFTSYEASRT